MKMITRILVMTILSGVYTMMSCTSDDKLKIPTEYDGETAEISFFAATPATTQVAARGEVGSEIENQVNNIYILVFDKNTEKLISKSKGKNLSIVSTSTNNNQYTFKATLPVGNEYTFMVLANAESYLNNIEVGLPTDVEKSDVLELVVSQTSKWSSSSPAIPMWGEKDLTLTSNSSPSFDLTRMLARINVEVNLKEVSPGVTKDNFKLTSVRYYNYNTSGTIVPDNYNNNAVSLPTIPTNPGTKLWEALVYNGADIENSKSCTEKIYVFEAAHNGKTYSSSANDEWSENPCLVIGGKYTTDDGKELDETFYRVDFIKKDNTNPNDVKDIWLSILRNFSYNVVITEVSGSGYPDPDIAVKSAPINLEANILEWNEGDMGEIVFDGMFYLSVSRDQLTVERGEVTTEQEEYLLYVKTDYIYANDASHVNSGWYVEKYVDATDETTPVTWLKLNPEKGAPNDRVKGYFTFEENPNEVNRTAIVWIAAGRLRYPVRVTQRVLSLYIIDPADNSPIDKILFEVPKNFSTVSSEKFQVKWTPINKEVSITHDSPRSWNPFQPDWVSPDLSNNSWTISPNSSPQEYTVNPPVVGQSDIDLDPFYERETTYSFTVESGVDSESKSITLHQIYYNIIVDVYSYKLDGKTYTLSVRSNTDWVITNIEEWLYNQDPEQYPATTPVLLRLNNYDNLVIGTKGGPNTAGETVAFTVVDQESQEHKNKWGTVYVTFENPDNKFHPIRVALSFPPKGLKVLGIGGTLDVRGFNPAKTSPYHNVSLHEVLSNEDNFGNNDNSVVKVNRLDFYAHNALNMSSAPIGDATDQYTFRTGDLKKWLNQYNPDIILISWAVGFNTTESELLKQYLENGGAIIMYYGGDVVLSRITNFFNTIFGRTFNYQDASTNNTYDIIDRYNYPTTGSVFQLENLDDPILTGPFRDIRGDYWGTHYRRVGIKASLIEDKVHVLSRTDSEQNSLRTGNNKTDPGYINMFRHKEYNLFWVGNGMGTATYYEYWNPREFYHDPNYVNSDGTPGLRTGFGGYASGTNGLRFDVCGSYLYANAMAWAISVTNHTPPPGGY